MCAAMFEVKRGRSLVKHKGKTQPKDQWSRKLQNTPIILFSPSYALMLSGLSGDTSLNCKLICIIVHINAAAL